MGLIVGMDGFTGLSSSSRCLEKQTGTLFSSRLYREGVWSSISIILLFCWGFLLFENILHSLTAFTISSEMLVTPCITCTFVWGRCGQQLLLCLRSKPILGRQITALSCFLDSNISLCSLRGSSTRCVNMQLWLLQLLLS